MIYIFLFLIFLYSVIIHEISHGLIAEKLGDPTARIKGRLTLNPISHIDPIGSIFLPIMLKLLNSGIIFGWAKPVPFDSFNLKNPRKDSALISLAGPIANLLIAIIFAILFRVFIITNFGLNFFLLPIFEYAVFINLLLCVFNFLPIHPLDGFKIVGGLLSEKQANEWYQLERFGVIFLLAFLFLPVGNSTMSNIILWPIIMFIKNILIPTSLGAGIV